MSRLPSYTQVEQQAFRKVGCTCVPHVTYEDQNRHQRRHGIPPRIKHVDHTADCALSRRIEAGLFDPEPYRHIPSFDELCPIRQQDDE